MDGIKITKRDTNALLRTLVSAIAANMDTKPIQQKWLMLPAQFLLPKPLTKVFAGNSFVPKTKLFKRSQLWQ